MAEISIAGQIAEARAHGFTDDQIAAHFTKHPEFGPGITEALGGGHKATQVLTQLSLATMPDYGGGSSPVPDPGLFRTLWNTLVETPKSLMDFASGHPATQMDKHFAEQAHTSGEAFRGGDIAGGVSSGLAAFLPGVGDEATAAGEEYGAGHPGAGTAHAAMALLPFLRRPIAAGVRRGAPIVSGAAKGAWEESTAPGSIKLKGFPYEIAAPKIAETTSLGVGAGGVMFGKTGAAVGGAAGAAYPIVTGAIKGGKKANAAFKAQGMPPPPASWTGDPSAVASTGVQPTTAPPVGLGMPLPPKQAMTPMPGEIGGEPIAPVSPAGQASATKVLFEELQKEQAARRAAEAAAKPEASTVISHPKDMPADYLAGLEKYGLERAQAAWEKDLAIAQRLKTQGVKPEDWDALDLEGKNSHARAVGKKAFDKGGKTGRGVDIGSKHVRNRLAELWGSTQ